MENKTLVIVESPGKIKKIQEYIGNKYIVKACCGHIRDLDKKTLSIDITNNFSPLYILNKDKLKIINEFKSILKLNNNKLLIATDSDREGEAIAYSLAEVLKISVSDRIIFNEITESALVTAINNPIKINNDIVNAQQTRRILDRLVGYMITPLLWKLSDNSKIESTGRVQSSTLQIIINKENKIKEHNYKSSYIAEIECDYSINKTNKFKLSGRLKYKDSVPNIIEPIESSDIENPKNIYPELFINDENIIEFLQRFTKQTILKIIDVSTNISETKAPLPFITSTLQQEAFTKLHYSIDKTMKIAQKLYESGLITYMRTDCHTINNDVLEKIKNYIINTYGSNYLFIKNLKNNNLKTSQQAHECIRPTNISIMQINKSEDENKLYNLIWNRTIASQMSNLQTLNTCIIIDASINNSSILFINNKQAYFYGIISNIIFKGYTIVYNNLHIDSSNDIKLNIDDILNFNKLIITEKYNNLPSRYNEASLVKYLEKKNIGRPSTFVSTIHKLLDRKYIEIKNISGIEKNINFFELSKSLQIKNSSKVILVGDEKKKIVPTEQGLFINQFMVEYFNSIINIEFTAEMESYLDKIANGNIIHTTVIAKFYSILEPIVTTIKKSQQYIPKNNTSELQIVGSFGGNNILYGTNKYGNYIKTFIDNKWKYVSINKPFNKIKEKEAIFLLQFPKTLGKINGNIVTLCHGKYGLYLSHNKKNYNVSDNLNINNIDLDFARHIIG